MSASPDAGPAEARLAGCPEPAIGPLRAAGLDVLGALSVSRYDGLVPPGWQSDRHVPGARSALVIGSGGSRLARRALADAGPDPVDAATRAAVDGCVAALVACGEAARALHGFERRSPDGVVMADDAGGVSGAEWADFVALGMEAGLGVPSRLRMLVHPHYGPWLAIRSVVLTSALVPPTRPLADFAPCEGCPAPCRDACPAGALDQGALSWPACRDERLRGGACATLCAARHACVLGVEHAHPADVEAHFMRGALAVAAREAGAAPRD